MMKDEVMKKTGYPVLKIDCNAIKENAKVICDVCGRRGIDIAGVIKFSDGELEIAKAYVEGGCKQIASSRTIHLERIKRAMPRVTTMLIRIPMMSEVEQVVEWCDISLASEETVLLALDEAAGRLGRTHSVILMQDVGDRREGIYGADEVLRIAGIVEDELDNLHLMGIGASFACVSGVLPSHDNLTELAETARRIEEAIGRKLEIVSGGSSVTLTLIADEEQTRGLDDGSSNSGDPNSDGHAGNDLYAGDDSIPPGINHLRVGGAIANPMGLRVNRGVAFAGMREDAFELEAEVVEVKEKPSAAGGVGKNWSGREVVFEDRGVRKRAIVALGSQDIGDCGMLVPTDPAVTIIAGSSDHTVLDVTESDREYEPGDVVSFRLFYMPMLYSFATRHVRLGYGD